MARGSVKIALLLFLQILGINGFPYPEIQAAQAIPAIPALIGIAKQVSENSKSPLISIDLGFRVRCGQGNANESQNDRDLHF